MSNQPTALELAAQLDAEIVRTVEVDMLYHRAAAELRRMHDRIEADEALLRQALAYILSDGDFLAPDAVESTRQLIAAIRVRLEGKA